MALAIHLALSQRFDSVGVGACLTQLGRKLSYAEADTSDIKSLRHASSGLDIRCRAELCSGAPAQPYRPAMDDDLEDLLDEPERPPWTTPPPLWHYTSARGFSGIVRSAKHQDHHGGGFLKATDAQFLNDASEVKYGLDVIADTIRQELSAEIRDEVLRSVNSLLAERTFVASFSESEHLLSQWRLYADDARGYCIRFDIRERLEAVEVDPNTARILVKCSYGADALRRDVVGRCRELTQNAAHGPRLVRALVRMARDAAIATKHPMFEEEREWRIIVDHVDDYVEYDTRRGRLVPFVYTDWLPIMAVLVGPRAGGARALEATRGFLRKHGVTANVDEWTVPYRGR